MSLEVDITVVKQRKQTMAQRKQTLAQYKHLTNNQVERLEIKRDAEMIAEQIFFQADITFKNNQEKKKYMKQLENALLDV